MKTYKLVNPSDAYTLLADDFEVATAACLLLGRGQYALKPEGHDGEGVPIFLFGGAGDWIVERFKCDLDTLFTRVKTQKLEALIACLESVLIGDRAIFDKALSLITDADKKTAWIEAWHDQHRTSLSDIGGYARRLAAHLRKEAA